MLNALNKLKLGKIMSPIIRAFFDRPTGSLQYVFHCPATREAAIVDPVWNFLSRGRGRHDRERG